MNSQGYDLENETTRLKMINLFDSMKINLKATSIVNGIDVRDKFHAVYNPSNLDHLLGEVSFASDDTIQASLEVASNFFPKWKNVEIKNKVQIINKLAELLESNTEKLLKICVLEAGKTIKDSIDDIREAIDFCYY